MISYCIAVYKEADCIGRLIDRILSCKKDNEQIIVVQTYKDEEETKEQFFSDINNILTSYKNIILSKYHFKNNFADLKNYMNSLATNEYIFNLDADEDYLCEGFDIIRNLILEEKHDLYYLARINTVDGLTEEDISRWNWKVNENGWINWPDFQPRVYKNTPAIKWYGPVHEHIGGTEDAVLIDPRVAATAIIHKKDISKQREQNFFYENMSKLENKKL